MLPPPDTPCIAAELTAIYHFITHIYACCLRFTFQMPPFIVRHAYAAMPIDDDTTPLRHVSPLPL